MKICLEMACYLHYLVFLAVFDVVIALVCAGYIRCVNVGVNYLNQALDRFYTSVDIG